MEKRYLKWSSTEDNTTGHFWVSQNITEDSSEQVIDCDDEQLGCIVTVKNANALFDHFLNGMGGMDSGNVIVITEEEYQLAKSRILKKMALQTIQEPKCMGCPDKKVIN